MMNPALQWSFRIVMGMAAAVLYTDAVYQHGVQHGQATKVCARVPGQQVVSSTADSCTYANSYGRSTTRRKAI